ncbi:MAG: sigma-70 family RNA polymerase sigma factor [Myxococcales bacterium]|nr:sigma-70 family RNA polymerase sigma factor [Myxococcales bacterium]
MADSSGKTDDAFIAEYRPLVVSIARRTRHQLDLKVDDDDLIAFGYQGLLEARSRFDSSRGVQFNTFAYYRVRGAIIDGVRAMAFLPRRAHERLKMAEAADQVAEGVAETAAQDPASTTAEMAAKTIDDTLAKLSASYVLNALGQDEASQPGSAEEQLIRAGEGSRVRAALDLLNERERALVTGFYFEGRRFDEVAAELGISKSWASRIHAKALERLKEALGSA